MRGGQAAIPCPGQFDIFLKLAGGGGQGLWVDRIQKDEPDQLPGKGVLRKGAGKGRAFGKLVVQRFKNRLVPDRPGIGRGRQLQLRYERHLASSGMECDERTRISAGVTRYSAARPTMIVQVVSRPNSVRLATDEKP